MKATISWHKNGAIPIIIATGEELGLYQQRFFNENMMVKKILHPDGSITWKLRERRLREKCRDMVEFGVGLLPYPYIVGDFEGFSVPFTPERQALMLLVKEIVAEEMDDVPFGFYKLAVPWLRQYNSVAGEMDVLCPTCMVRTKPHRGGFEKDLEDWTETLELNKTIASGLPVLVYVRALKKSAAGGGPMSDDEITKQVELTLDILPEAHIVVSGKDPHVAHYMRLAHDIIEDYCPCVKG